MDTAMGDIGDRPISTDTVQRAKASALQEKFQQFLYRIQGFFARRAEIIADFVFHIFLLCFSMALGFGLGNYLAWWLSLALSILTLGIGGHLELWREWKEGRYLARDIIAHGLTVFGTSCFVTTLYTVPFLRQIAVHVLTFFVR